MCIYITQSPFPPTVVPDCFKTWNLERGGECARIILFYDMLCVCEGYVGRLYLYIHKGLDKPSQRVEFGRLFGSFTPSSFWLNSWPNVMPLHALVQPSAWHSVACLLNLGMGSLSRWSGSVDWYTSVFLTQEFMRLPNTKHLPKTCLNSFCLPLLMGICGLCHACLLKRQSGM